MTKAHELSKRYGVRSLLKKALFSRLLGVPGHDVGDGGRG
jgi:hypothetical protein